MSNLVLTPNGKIRRKNRPGFDQFPSLGTFLNDIWSEDMPSVLRSNFNEGMTLPKVNIKESSESFEVQMAVPGFKKDNLLKSRKTRKKQTKSLLEKNLVMPPLGEALSFLKQ